jgi:hypothetical protein
MMSALSARVGRIAAWVAAMMVISITSQFALGQEPPKNFVMHDAPKPIPALEFGDAEGRS